MKTVRICEYESLIEGSVSDRRKDGYVPDVRLSAVMRGAKHTTLIYPMPVFPDTMPLCYHAVGGTQVHLWLVDLLDLMGSIRGVEVSF